MEIRKPITKVLVNFEVNKCKNFETFKTFLVILNYKKNSFKLRAFIVGNFLNNCALITNF